MNSRYQKFTNLYNISIFITFIAFSTWAFPVNAAFTVFKDDPTGFEASASGIKSEYDFSASGTTALGSPVINSRIEASIFSIGDIIDGLQIQSGGNEATTLGSDLTILGGNIGPGNDTDRLIISFIGKQVLAAGFNITTESAGADIEVYGTSGTLITSDTIIATVTHFGIVSDSSIGHIIIDAPASSAGNVERASKVTFYTPGDEVLISKADEASGVNCENGGTVVMAGKDLNANDTLDTAEIETTEYVCLAAQQAAEKSSGCGLLTGPAKSTFPLFSLLFGFLALVLFLLRARAIMNRVSA